MEKKWYFKYDPQTFEFIPGSILAEEQPENTTDIEPTGFYGLPKWNTSTNSWIGDSMDSYLSEKKSSAKQQVDSVQKQMASIVQMLVAQKADNMALKSQIAALSKQGGNTNA